MIIAVVVAFGVLVSAQGASAKVLPYELDVDRTRTRVGKQVTITLIADPQNWLGESFDWEIAVYRRSETNSAGWPRPRAKPVEKVMMRLVDDQTYEGVFAAPRSGRYLIVGRTARADVSRYPSPIPITIRAARGL